MTTKKTKAPAKKMESMLFLMVLLMLASHFGGMLAGAGNQWALSIQVGFGIAGIEVFGSLLRRIRALPSSK